MANSLFNWLAMGLVAVLHPFFVSVIELNHNTKDKTLEASIRIYVDDLEATLKNNAQNIDLLHPADKNKVDAAIASYILSKLQVKVDGKPVQFSYLGYEIKQESVWVYFEAPNISSIKKVETTCTLLHDFKKEQINIFHVKANGTEKSSKLDYPASKASFEF